MTAHDFTVWLSGFDEINGTVPTAAQWEIIRDHLYLALDKTAPAKEYPEVTPVAPYVPPIGSGPAISCATRTNLPFRIESSSPFLLNPVSFITC